MLRVINDEDAKVAARRPPPNSRTSPKPSTRSPGASKMEAASSMSEPAPAAASVSSTPAKSPQPSPCPATLVQGLIAGGDSALRKSSESSEDSAEQGAADLAAAGFTGQDALVGIAASGRTPYVIGALEHANPLGAVTIALTCVPNSPMSAIADITIAPITGPEVLTGSTRLKAGTATKLVLNMLSTGVMIKTGAVYGNLMVNLAPTNVKLVDRAERIIIAATGVSPTHRRRAPQTIRQQRKNRHRHAKTQPRPTDSRSQTSRPQRQPLRPPPPNLNSTNLSRTPIVSS